MSAAIETAAIAMSAAFVAGGLFAFTVMTPHTPSAEELAYEEMLRVEFLLTAHGVPVEGFAETDPVDLAVIDAIAPAGCAGVMRAGVLARLAVVRVAPSWRQAAPDVAAGAAAAAASDLNRLDCLEIRP